MAKTPTTPKPKGTKKSMQPVALNNPKAVSARDAGILAPYGAKAMSKPRPTQK